MILVIIRTNKEITITINIYTFINLNIKLIFYFLKCEDFSYIIYINKREYVRKLSVYKSCKTYRYDLNRYITISFISLTLR